MILLSPTKEIEFCKALFPECKEVPREVSSGRLIFIIRLVGFIFGPYGRRPEFVFIVAEYELAE